MWLFKVARWRKEVGVYGRVFANAPPSRTTVQAAGLPKDALVEIDVVRPLDRKTERSKRMLLESIPCQAATFGVFMGKQDANLIATARDHVGGSRGGDQLTHVAACLTLGAIPEMRQSR